MILFVPDIFLRSEHDNVDSFTANNTDSDSIPARLNNRLLAISEAADSLLTESEKQRLNKIAKYGEKYIVNFTNPSNFKDILTLYWESNIPPEIYYLLKAAYLHLDENFDPENQVLSSRAQPDWYIGFSHEFVKSISKVDLKKRGRILEALGKIASSPTEMAGDTIKPLSGDLLGLWRCRLGNDRLLYYPDIEAKKIVLISFGPRGDAYTKSIGLPDKI